MARRSRDPTTVEEIAERWPVTRRALGHSQVAMARLMGSATVGQAWENYEAGRRRISIDHALALCRTCGLTLAWIYQGQMDSLPKNLYDKIQQMLPSGQTTRKTRAG